MERKSTQRIIGILVIIALVIILLPLLFGKNDLINQVSTIKAPPFPDQQTADANDTANNNPLAANSNVDVNSESGQVSAAANPPTTSEAVEIPIEVANTAVTNSETNPNTSDIQAANAPTPPASTPNKEKEVSANKPVVIENDSNTVVLGSNTFVTTNDSTAPQTNASTSSDVKKEVKNLKHFAKNNAAGSSAKIKSATAWAVQMGSFKVKKNAVRLADKLRAAGYKAFTKEVKSSTRVYVGPEFKQASAVNLSNQIQQNTKMHGIIVTFKPLEL